MPKILQPRDLDSVLDLLAQHPEGMSIDGLVQLTGQGIPRRTLQRRLAMLVDQERAVTKGNGRSLRYFPAPRPLDTTYTRQDQASYQLPAETNPFLSPEGEEVRAYVRRPRQQRQPVGYKIEFLEQYQPNHTSYLPESLRTQLHQIGRSSAEHAAAGTFARDILSRLLIDLSWASSRLEGNTYSRLDTERLIQFGEAAEGKDALETQMILNHKAAIEYLVSDPANAQVAPDNIIALHAFLSDSLMPDPMACGRLRIRPVDIGGSVYLPLALPQKVAELFGIVVDMAAEIRDPFEQAFFLMVHLPYLQPFEDVNKRVSRLAANIPFIRHNLSPLAFIDVPQQAYIEGILGVYELTRVDLLRDVFVWAYERSCQQYVAVRQQLVPPDTFRLRYRVSLNEVVSAIVRKGVPASEEAIIQNMPRGVSAADRERFVKLVQDEFKAIHSGNAIRFGLRPMEFGAWQEQTGGKAR